LIYGFIFYICDIGNAINKQISVYIDIVSSELFLFFVKL
jgi:hypothetical protein